jgi:hypothetical protein
MTEIDSLIPTPNDTLVSHSNPEHEDRGRVDDFVISELEGHQQTGLAADGNFSFCKVERNV